MYKFDVNSFRSVKSNVSDPGYFSRIRFFIPDSGLIRSRNRICIRKLILISQNKIRDIHPGSWFWIFSIPNPDRRVKKAPDPGSGSATLINSEPCLPFFLSSRESVMRKLHLIAHFVVYWENLRNCFTSLVAKLFFVLSSMALWSNVTAANHCGSDFNPPRLFMQTRKNICNT